jgi:tetratricopeptide (TPR) repeat protein
MLTDALAKEGNIETAIEKQKEAVEIFKEINSPQHKFDLANSLINLSNFLVLNGDSIESESLLKEALEIYENLSQRRSARFKDEISEAREAFEESKELVQPESLETWKSEVMKVLTKHDGQATLGDLYKYIQIESERDLPKFWKAVIRYTLQTYSSDTQSWNGVEDLFERLDRGRWGIKNFKT